MMDEQKVKGKEILKICCCEDGTSHFGITVEHCNKCEDPCRLPSDIMAFLKWHADQIKKDDGGDKNEV